MSSRYERRLTTFGDRTSLVTPSDDTDLASVAKAVVCATAGDLSIIPESSDVSVAFVGLPAGYVPPFRVRRVNATGTTATVYTVEE